MKKRGVASTIDELKKWPASKLTDEIAKQIRMDCGGQDARIYLSNKAKVAFHCSEEQAAKLAEFAYDFASKQLLGSRKRIRSKLNEIDNRLTD